MLIAVVDGLKGFPDAITGVFPQAQVQTCIVHLIRNSLDFVSYTDRKAVAAALKSIYKATRHAPLDRHQRGHLPDGVGRAFSTDFVFGGQKPPMACAPTRLWSSLPVAGPSIAGAGSSLAARARWLDEAYVSFLGAFGAAWDDAMVARWSANPLGMLWPEMDAVFVTSGGEIRVTS